MVTSSEMRTRHDEQAADVAVGRDVAQLGPTPRTEEPFGLKLGVAGAQSRESGVGQTGGEAHHHKVGRRRGGLVGATCGAKRNLVR